MGKKSKVLTELPSNVKQELNKRLLENGFSDYVALSDWLDEQGYSISKSSIHRYSKKFQKEHQAISIATEQAKVLAETIPDDEGAMAEALTRVAQNKLYDALVGLDVESYLEEDTVENLPKLVGAIAKLNQSSVSLKKYQQEVRSKLKAASEEISQIVVKGGLSDTAVDAIKNRILGVA